MIVTDFDILATKKFDVCVVGAGIVGLSLAIELDRRGLSVLVLESGMASASKKARSLSNAFVESPDAHHPMENAVARSLGGTSSLWGGRCVLLDKIDFEKRDYIPGSGWPVNFEEYAKYVPRASALLGCDDDSFIHRDWPQAEDSTIEAHKLERWINETRIHRYHSEIATTEGITVLLDATVVGAEITPGDQKIAGVHVAREGRRTTFTGARYFVLALGGVETARLLLNVQAEYPRLSGSGHLGRNYMGHMSGVIASIQFNDPNSARYFANYENVRSFGRRRFTITKDCQLLNRLPNIAFWPDNQHFANPVHESGLLSAIALLLRIPIIGGPLLAEALKGPARQQTDLAAHLLNILRDVPGIVGGAAEIVRQRVIYRRRLPRLFIMDRSGTYPLRFHAEQLPNWSNRVRLSEVCDRYGMRRVVIEFKFRDEEMEPIRRAHEILDRSLRQNGIGSVIYHDRDAWYDSVGVPALTADGLHQIGLTRMASNPSEGVVDSDCRIFELQNLFVASSAVFPTSSQAAPTLPAVAMAVRIANHLERRIVEDKRPISVGTADQRSLAVIPKDLPGKKEPVSLNILFVTASYYPAVRYGGPIYTVRGLARALVERGHRVVVYTTDVDGDERVDIETGVAHTIDGVEVWFFPSKYPRIFWSRGMIDMLRDNAGKFDIIHANGSFLYPTVAARRAANRAGVPFIYSPRGMLVLELFRKKNAVLKILWTLLFERKNCRRAAFVHATSRLEAEEIKRLHLHPARTEVIFNGVDVAHLADEQPKGADDAPVPDRYKPYLLSLGRVSWKKGLDRLIMALKYVPSVNLVIAGNDEEAYSKTLEKIIHECGLGERVFFIGPVYGEKKLHWMSEAELFVLSSYSESFGVVAIEAMASGCAVVMSPEVGISEVIQDAGAGIIVPGDPKELGPALAELLADTARREAMGRMGREKVNHLFSWQMIAEQMEKAYRGCSAKSDSKIKVSGDADSRSG